MNGEENKNNSKPKGIRKTILLIIFLALITLALLYAAISSKTNNPSPNKMQSVNTEAAQTTLEISPNLIKDATSSAYKTVVSINTGQNKVTSVQLELSFDPNVLTKVDILPGTFFENPNIFLKTVDEVNGRISYAIGVLPCQDGVSGKGILANISFSTLPSLKNISTTINFEPKTQVSGEDSSVSILKTSSGTSFILNKTLIGTPSSTLLKTGSSSAQK